MNKAPGSKLAPWPIITGPLGPSILMGFVQAQTPLGWRLNLFRNSASVTTVPHPEEPTARMNGRGRLVVLGTGLVRASREIEATVGLG